MAVMASSSIPAIFPPTNFHDMWLMDGGTISNVNIESAILQCHEMGVTDPEKIIVDVTIVGAGWDPGFTP